MARKSRFRAPVQEKPKLRVYSTGAYVRLSVLDGHQCDSDSIENQEALVRAYVESDPSLSLFSVYSDNGETGVDFERDDFERLLDDIRAGKVDCVIVKDLSRFGRNYIEAGEYLEKIFPFMGVRFIAVNDGYDSIDPAASDSLSMHLKNLVNDVYARDISQKICPVLQEKQERGEFIGNWAAYGYLKSAEDKHRLVVDEETAPVVRDIFQWRLIGMDYQEIAKRLTELGIPSPSRYRFEKGMVKSKRFAASVWTGQVIKNMVRSEVYLGHVVQGKTRKALWKGQKRTTQPREKWTVVKNTHEAIIDRQTFDEVQRMAEQDKQTFDDRQGAFPEIINPENILKGLVYCGDCGRKLVRQRRVHESKVKNPGIHVRYFFYCHTHAEDSSRCVGIRVPEDTLLETVSQVIRSHFATALDMERLIKSAGRKALALSKKQEILHRIMQAEEQLDRIARLRETLYDDYLDHLMDEHDYLYARNRYIEQEEEQRALLEELESQNAAVMEPGTGEPAWLRALLSIHETSELTRGMVLELIDRIIVYSSSNIAVRLRFEDEYECMKERLFPPMGVAASE
nr:recombinase family protein [uncultured Lachnoclostridium sp.]